MKAIAKIKIKHNDSLDPKEFDLLFPYNIDVEDLYHLLEDYVEDAVFEMEVDWYYPDLYQPLSIH
jgi:hypothetical protein